MVVMVVVAMVKSLDPAVVTQLLIVFPLTKKITTGGAFGVLVFPLA